MLHRSIKQYTAVFLSMVLMSSFFLANLTYADSGISATSISSNLSLNASVERQSDGKLQVSWQSSVPLTGNVDIYWSQTPDQFSNDHLIKTVTGVNSVTISDPNPSARSYFMVKASGLRATAAERKVNLQGAHNFRDLGGYATTDGHTVKWGTLFRGEQLNHLTDADQAYLVKSGLKTVVDYRSDSEIATAQDPVIPGVTEVKDPVVQDVNGSMDMASVTSAETAVAAFVGFQRKMVQEPQVDAYKKLFQLLLDSNNLALVQHCTAGKDRTGLGSALTLLALGVPEDTIMKDYLLSNTYNAESNAQQLAAMPENMRAIYGVFLGVQKEFLQASLDQIKIDNGSYDNFFQNVIGLSAQDRQKLKDMYLVNAVPTAVNDLSAEVVRQSDNSLNISWDSSAPVVGDAQIYWSTQAGNFSEDHLLKTVTNATSVNVIDPNPSSRVYFLIVADGRMTTTAERKVNLQGAHNFRDLGGYATTDGHTVKWGLLYRGEQLNHLTNADQDYLVKSGLKTVVDYRSDGEIATGPDPIMPGVTEVVDPVSKDLNNTMDMSGVTSAETAVAAFVGFQRKMVEEPQVDAYKNLFQLLLDSNNLALVQHCTAGKDRTGLGSALILLALGVPEDTIMKDYLLSNTYNAESNAQQLAAMPENMRAIYGVFLGVQKEFLQASLDQIKIDNGSYDNFFQNVIGLTAQDRQKLKDLYLANAVPTGVSDLSAEVVRQSDNSLNISLDSSAPILGDVQIYWSAAPNNFNKDHLLATVSDPASIKVSDPNPSARSYFLIIADGRMTTTAERKVNLQGAHNFRDLGGYATTDGHIVKWGTLYRGEQLNHLTDADQAYLVNSGLKTVVDYRSDGEIATGPDPIMPGVTEVVDPVSKDLNNTMDMSGVTSADTAVAAFVGFQRKMVQEPQVDAYKNLFQLLLDSNNLALVQHCTAGKDRTGLGSALILLALGVPEDTIMKDYLLSNKYNAESNAQQLAAMPENMRAIYGVFLGVQKEFLQASLDQIKLDNGSYDNFFQNVIGLTAQDRQKLKDMYLQQPVMTGFDSADYVNNLVTASIHSNVYTNDPSVSIYDPTGNLIQTATVVSSTYLYSVTSATYTYNYKVQASVDGNYSAVQLVENVTGTLATNVNHVTTNTTKHNSSPSVGGGGVAPATPASTLSVPESGAVDGNVLSNSLKQFDTIQLTASGSGVKIPASALAGYDGGTKTIVVQSGSNSYTLPLSILKLDALAQELGVDATDLTIQVSISPVADSANNDLNKEAAAIGVTPIGEALDFQVNVLDKSGHSTPLSLGNTYVNRSISLAQQIDASNATGVMFDPISHKLSFVPTVFSYANGQTTATMKRNGNSVYAIIQSDKTFGDITGHWAKKDIELLVNKQVVDGVSASQFEPDRNITRAEFAAIISRSLGLTLGSYHGTFTDVTASDWYANALGAAINAGIINGYEDGTFRPNAPIHREELAAMVMRAMTFAGAGVNLSSSEQEAALTKFTDNGSISWARKDVAAAIKTGILNGLTNTTLAAGDTATRAQAVSMVERFLTAAKFIN